MLAAWQTRESAPGREVDPDLDALIAPGEGITLGAADGDEPAALAAAGGVRR